MRTHRLALVIVGAWAVVAGFRAPADEKPPKARWPEAPIETGGQPKQAIRGKDLQELEKRLGEEFLAECKENDRLFQQTVKANPRDVRTWLLLGWNATYN